MQLLRSVDANRLQLLRFILDEQFPETQAWHFFKPWFEPMRRHDRFFPRRIRALSLTATLPE